MNKLINKDQEVLDQLIPDGHKDNHPFLRILYNTKGYYEFWIDQKRNLIKIFEIYSLIKINQTINSSIFTSVIFTKGQYLILLNFTNTAIIGIFII